jgi:hypothetical protein
MGIKKLILSLPFVKDEIRRNSLYSVEQTRRYLREDEERRHEQMMNLRLGMPIIILTPETTPELGVITGWFNKDVPIVKVYSNRIVKEVTLFSTYIPYNAQNFQLLYNMKKSEALGLINPVHQEKGKGFTIKNEDNRDGRVYMDTVNDAAQNGFFELAKEYWKKKRGMAYE